MQRTNKNIRYLTFLILGIVLLFDSEFSSIFGQTPVSSDTLLVLKSPAGKDRLDTPYGTVFKDSYLGAASVVYTDRLEKTLTPTILPALAGRLSGLSISQYAGILQHQTSRSSNWDLAGWMPVWGSGNYSDNSQFSVGLRGNSPVVLVDGVERELFTLDPEAIESVSVQKDALSS
ncbi:MAG: TonB-dependent receptor plug domain-containing protein, partial [Candidatus Symbiothrix sp.]|nr:TonB-dependent receptor plug domain-containing protein [Candidatus Symbiothrix sp.]